MSFTGMAVPYYQSPMSEPEETDSKDIVEQIRTVHFAILLICLAAMVVVLGPGTVAGSRASEQLDRIVAVKKSWKPEWIAQRAEAVAKQHGECSDGRFPPRAYVQFAGERFTPLIARKYDVIFKAPPGFETTTQNGSIPTVAPPDTLTGFRKLWDSRGQVVCPEADLLPRQGDSALAWDRQMETYVDHGKVFSVALGSGQQVAEKRFVWVRNLRHLDVPIAGQSAGLLQTGDDYPWLFPSARTEARHYDFQISTQIIGDFPQYAWKADSFDIAFPELDKATVGLQDMTLEHLQKRLQAEEDAAKEEFSAFGVKFPVGATAHWGVFLILISQVYLLIHLIEYERRGFPESSVGWIGLYRNWSARVLTIITMSAVPLLVVIVLCLHERILQLKYLNIAIVGIAIWIELALAGYAALTLPSLTSSRVSKT
jgi:hypothetical protein